MNYQLSEQAGAPRCEAGQGACAACEEKQPAAGLYRESYEHDARGIGRIGAPEGRAQPCHAGRCAVGAGQSLEHRGGTGLERNTGDGAGVLFQIPHRFFRKEAQKEGQLLPGEGDYGVAMPFLPHDDEVGVRREARLRRKVARSAACP